MEKKSGTILGRVLDEGGLPLPNMVVTASDGGVSRMTDERGEFCLSGVRPKPLGIGVAGAHHGPFSFEQIAPGQEVVELRLPGPCNRHVRGRVIDPESDAIGPVAVLASGDVAHTNDAHTQADSRGRFDLTRLQHAPYFFSFGREGGHIWLCWDDPGELACWEIMLPNDAQEEALRAERAAREAHAHETDTPILLVKSAYLANPANLGPLPIRDGLWMLRGIKATAVGFRLPRSGEYEIHCVARRACEATIPRLKLSWDEEAPQVFTVNSEDWTELSAKTEVAAGPQVLKLQLADGWGVDVTSVTVAGK